MDHEIRSSQPEITPDITTAETLGGAALNTVPEMADGEHEAYLRRLMESDPQVRAALAGMFAEVDRLRAENGILITYRDELEKAVGEDVAAYDEKERRLQQEGMTDGLTGLANMKAWNLALPRAEESPTLEIISFDANGFGAINKMRGSDSVGKLAGDREIQEMAHGIQAAAVEFGLGERSVFRIGGDEFTVIAPKGRMVEYRPKDADPDTPVEYLSIAEAVTRRAAENYGARHFTGVDLDTGAPMETTISLSGSVGDTFASADEPLQLVKKRRKAELQAQREAREENAA